MKIIEVIHLDKIPSGTAQQRNIGVRNGRAVSYPKDSLIEARIIYRMALMNLKKPPRPMTGPIKLSLTFYYKTDDKKKLEEFYKTTKPDVDNLAKVFTDQLTYFRYFKDDNQVTTLSVSKRWATENKLFFCIEEYKEEKVWMRKNILQMLQQSASNLRQSTMKLKK